MKTADQYRTERNERADRLERLALELLDPAAGESAAWTVTTWPDGHTCREWLTVRPLEAGQRVREAALDRRLIVATSSHADRLSLTP